MIDIPPPLMEYDREPNARALFKRGFTKHRSTSLGLMNRSGMILGSPHSVVYGYTGMGAQGHARL